MRNPSKDCDEKFDKFSDLTKHRRAAHKKERPSDGIFECDICQAKIKTKSALNAHVRNLHSDSVDHYQCGDCLNMYKSKRNHMGFTLLPKLCLTP